MSDLDEQAEQLIKDRIKAANEGITILTTLTGKYELDKKMPVVEVGDSPSLVWAKNKLIKNIMIKSMEEVSESQEVMFDSSENLIVEEQDLQQSRNVNELIHKDAYNKSIAVEAPEIK